MKEVIMLGNSNKIKLDGYRDDEISLGSLSGIKLWFEGDSRVYSAETKHRFDRANGEYRVSEATSIVAEIRNKMLINVNASNTIGTTGEFTNIPVTLANAIPEEFTICIVARRLRSDQLGYYINHNGTGGTNEKIVRIGFNSSGRLTWWEDYANKILLSAESTAIVEAIAKPHILTATYSKNSGIAIFLNGNLVASNKSHVLQLDSRDFILGGIPNLAQGHILMFDRDISLDITSMTKLHETLKKYYEIN